MQPVLIILLAAAAGVALGLRLRHNLATLSYRNPDEVNLPDPGPRWWVVWASVIVLGSLAGVAALSHNPLAYLPLVPLAATGPWLAAVDFDVLRLPNRVLGPAAAATMLAVVGISVATQDWMTLILPLAASVTIGGVLAVVHFATMGGIGFGDVKLAAAIGLAVEPLGVSAPWISILVGSAAGIVWSKTTRIDTPLAYGPWLLIGAWTAAFVGGTTPG